MSGFGLWDVFVASLVYSFLCFLSRINVVNLELGFLDWMDKRFLCVCLNALPRRFGDNFKKKNKIRSHIKFSTEDHETPLNSLLIN